MANPFLFHQTSVWNSIIYTSPVACLLLAFFPSFFHVQTVLGIIWLMTYPLWSSQPTPSTSLPHNLMISCLGIENFASYSSGGGGGGVQQLVQKGRRECYLCMPSLPIFLQYSLWIPIFCSVPFLPIKQCYITIGTPAIHFQLSWQCPRQNKYEALTTKTFIWKPPSVDEWIKKMWSMDRMEFYSVTKKKNEILTFVTTWMDLKDDLLI